MRRLLPGVCLFTLLAWGQDTLSRGDETLRAGWECLPAECAAALRLPNGHAFTEAWKTQTRFGAIVLSPDRLATVLKWFSEEDGPFRSFGSEIEKMGLDVADLPHLLAGETGIAFLVDGASSGESMPMALVWCEPGEELGARTMNAIERHIELTSDQEHPIQRVDVELEDHPVMQLTLPFVSVESGEVEFPDNYESLSEEEQEAAMEKAVAESEKHTKTTVRYVPALLSRWGQRIVFQVGLAPQENAITERDWERNTGAYVKFLRSQTGEPGEFAARATSNADLQRAWGHPGVPFLEMLVDPRPYFEVISRESHNEQIEKALEAMGLNQLGVIAGRWTLEDTVVRIGLFMTAPTPRKGLMTLLDQTAIPVDPPNWVPADVLEYQHFSFDLGVAFKTIKELLVAQVGEQVNTSLGFVETQVRGHTGTDVAGLLSSVGNIHSSIRFMPEKGTSESAEGEDEQERVAVVWQLRDAEVWTRVMEAIGEFAPLAEIKVKATEEQGFRGWRTDGGSVEGGIVMGKGYLVLGTGTGTLERVLASINNPPTGPDALVSSPLYQQARAVLPPEPGFIYSISDRQRSSEAAFDALETLMNMEEQLPGRQDEDGSGAKANGFTLEHLRSILPDKAEMQGVLGVEVGQARATDQGWLSESVIVMPK